MKTLKYSDESEWLHARLGRITGTKAGSLISKRNGTPLKGYYEVIAERIAIPHNGENVMDRGKRLEDEALDRFEKETGHKLDRSLYICVREDNENIAYSPDALIGQSCDLEVKCLSSASHIEAYLTREVPSEYEAQIIQGFVVNDNLKTRYMVFYDPRMPKDFFYLTLKREDWQERADEFLRIERLVLEQVEKIVTTLTF